MFLNSLIKVIAAIADAITGKDKEGVGQGIKQTPDFEDQGPKRERPDDPDSMSGAGT